MRRLQDTDGHDHGARHVQHRLTDRDSSSDHTAPASIQCSTTSAPIGLLNIRIKGAAAEPRLVMNCIGVVGDIPTLEPTAFPCTLEKLSIGVLRPALGLCRSRARQV
jgi:hypothetical protein